MDNRVKEVMEKAMQGVENDLRNLEPAVNAKMGQSIELCFGKNTSNADRFADCVVEKNKKIEDIMKLVEFKLLYFSKVANNCLVNQKPINDCTQETTTGLKSMIDSLKVQLEKI